MQNGFDYFGIGSRATDAKRQYDTFGPAYRSYYFSPRYYSPRYGWLPYYDPFWNDPINIREVTRYEASAEISMYKGAKPASDSRAFDARDVQQNLAGKVAPPPARS